MVALAVALVATVAVARPARAAGPEVVVYGDSLVYEMIPYANHLFRDVAGMQGHVIGVGGAATCDLLDEMRADAARFRPRAVVIAFSGNAFTPCMRGPEDEMPTREKYIARYRAASVEAVRIWRGGAPTIWFADPPINGWADPDDPETYPLQTMHASLARDNPRVRVVNAGAAVLWQGKYWTRWLPCLPRELCTGGVDIWGRPSNIVRSFDTVHFCPVPGGQTRDCPTHSGGALRYAIGMLAPVFQSLGRWEQAKVANSLAAGWQG